MKRPKAPKPTAQELAGVARQSRMIDEQTEEIEKRLKAATRRNRNGSSSLLAKAGGSTSGSTRGSMFSGGRAGTGSVGGSSGSGGGGYTATPRTMGYVSKK